MSSFKVLESGDAKIMLLENYPCKNRKQLHAREVYYIDKLNCINKNIPTIK